MQRRIYSYSSADTTLLYFIATPGSVIVTSDDGGRRLVIHVRLMYEHKTVQTQEAWTTTVDDTLCEYLSLLLYHRILWNLQMVHLGYFQKQIVFEFKLVWPEIKIKQKIIPSIYTLF